MDSQCKQSSMGGISTYQQNWNNCAIRSTNTSGEMKTGYATKIETNKSTSI